MGQYAQFFLFILAGLFFLWLGLSFLFGRRKGPFLRKFGPLEQRPGPAAPGRREAARPCPVCGALLGEGELVQSVAFPSANSGDRLMHIRGCEYCLAGKRDRVCPVCGGVLKPEEILIARMFERPGRKHVHVLGCTRCRRPPRR